MRCLRKLREGIKNFWKFRKVVWNYRWWDYIFFYDFIIFILKDMSEEHKIKSHIVKEESERIIKKMKIMIHCLERILEGDYCREERDEHHKKFPLIFINNRIQSGHDKESGKNLRKIWEKEKNLKNRDWDLFLKYMRQSERFWD